LIGWARQDFVDNQPFGEKKAQLAADLTAQMGEAEKLDAASERNLTELGFR
jgi:hypothetical protein